VVWDPTNYVPTLNTFLQVVEQVNLIKKDLSELGAFDSMNAQTVSMLHQLMPLLQQVASRLLGRYARWTQILPVGNQIPCTIAGLAQWNQVYDRDTEQALADVAFAQTLLNAQGPNLQLLVQAVQAASQVIGAVSGLQSLHSRLDQLVALASTVQTMKAPFLEAEARKEMRVRVNQKAAAIMSENRTAGMYGRAKQTCTPVPGV
jgi:hypothetical protein